MRVFLNFAPAHGAIERARLTYAFRLFCGIYGHQPILQRDDAAGADAWISYSEPPKYALGRTVQLADSFRARDPREAAPPPRSFATNDEVTVLVHPPFKVSTPDWLGEIFEWVSCADEYGVSQRDSVGRIFFPYTYAGRYQLDIRVPYAAIAMRQLQREIAKIVPTVPIDAACPIRGGTHFIVNTHDVDFIPLNRLDSTRRLTKNAGISLLLYKSPKLALQQLGKLLALIGGKTDPFDQVFPLAELERQRSLGASYFFIPIRQHCRDANYSLDNPGMENILQSLEQLGMEVGIHASYTSLDTTCGLQSEVAYMRERGFCPIGGRQHWLRFTLKELIPAMRGSEVQYDTSLGWSDRAGFRAGACFAFPPYDFERETAATFLEIPLVIMDQALLQTHQNRFQEAAELLANSRRYGWGGISLLWHPSAFDGVQYPEEIGSVFWDLVGHRLEWNDTWVSGLDFLEAVRQRYESVGFHFCNTETAFRGIAQ